MDRRDAIAAGIGVLLAAFGVVPEARSQGLRGTRYFRARWTKANEVVIQELFWTLRGQYEAVGRQVLASDLPEPFQRKVGSSCLVSYEPATRRVKIKV